MPPEPYSLLRNENQIQNLHIADTIRANSYLIISILMLLKPVNVQHLQQKHNQSTSLENIADHVNNPEPFSNGSVSTERKITARHTIQTNHANV